MQVAPKELVQLRVLPEHVDGLEVVVGSELVVGLTVGGHVYIGHPYVGLGLVVGLLL